MAFSQNLPLEPAIASGPEFLSFDELKRVGDYSGTKGDLGMKRTNHPTMRTYSRRYFHRHVESTTCIFRSFGKSAKAACSNS
jgi:hypothetical protein